MTKLDIENAYWGTWMPKGMENCFVFEYSGKMFSLLTLPYGWNRSPWIFQKKLGECITQSLNGGHTVILNFQYIDDVLLLGNDFDRLRIATLELCEAIRNKGWHLSKKKVITTPCKSLTWLGKVVTIMDDCIRVSIANDTLIEIMALILWVCAKPFAGKVLSSLNGLLSWCSLHSRLGLPFLHAGHVFLKNDAYIYPHPPQQVRAQLVKALWYVALPADKQAIVPATSPKLGVPWIFADAAAVTGFGGLVVSLPDSDHIEIFSKPLPCDMHGEENQQIAELYMLKRAAIHAKSNGWSEFVYIGDNLATLWSGKKMSAPCSMSRRARVLRQIAMLFDNNYWCTIRLAHTVSFLNPADPPSRPPYESEIPGIRLLARILKLHPELIAWHYDEWSNHKQYILMKLKRVGVSLPSLPALPSNL